MTFALGVAAGLAARFGGRCGWLAQGDQPQRQRRSFAAAEPDRLIDKAG